MCLLGYAVFFIFRYRYSSERTCKRYRGLLTFRHKQLSLVMRLTLFYRTLLKHPVRMLQQGPVVLQHLVTVGAVFATADFVF